MTTPTSTLATEGSTPVEPGRTTLRLGTAPDDLRRAAGLLRAAGLVAFPTETVYGLGADAGDAIAVAALYAAKGRPRFNPLIAHLADTKAALGYGRFSAIALRLADAFWPGPLTIVVPAAGERICDLARAGLGSVALRVPAHPVARTLIAAAGRPVVAPSANLSGRISPTTAGHVAADLAGRINAIVDGGPTTVGIESTIVSCLDEFPRLLRPGGIARDAIEAVLGFRLLEEGAASDGGAPVAPGLLASHYAPRARVRLHADAIRPGEAALLFGGTRPPGLDGAAAVIDLSPGADVAEAAAALFGALRTLAASGASVIAVSPIPDGGLGEAIRDRLARAAADRP